MYDESLYFFKKPKTSRMSLTYDTPFPIFNDLKIEFLRSVLLSIRNHPRTEYIKDYIKEHGHSKYAPQLHPRMKIEFLEKFLKDNRYYKYKVYLSQYMESCRTKYIKTHSKNEVRNHPEDVLKNILEFVPEATKFVNSLREI